MLHLKPLQVCAASLLLSGAASAFAADLEISRSISLEKNVDVTVDKSIDVDKKVDVSIDRSKRVENSFNRDEKISYDNNLFAYPIAETTLDGTVTDNSVNTGGKALKQETQQLNQASASGNALQGFRGVNSGGNVNAGANSLVQTSVTISAVVVRAF